MSATTASAFPRPITRLEDVDLPNKQLMEHMGSDKGSDPIPPDQYLYFLNDSDPRQRMLAFVRSKTIRHGHRCRYCVDEHGQPIILEQVAAHFSWTMKYARAIWLELENEGLVFEVEGRLHLSGKVTLPPDPEKCNPTEKGFCTESFADYLTHQIEQLEPDVRAKFDRDYQTYSRYERKVKAEAVALARSLLEPRQAQFFARFGIDVKHYKKRRNGEGKEMLKVEWAELPDEFVQILQTDSVQTEIPNSYNAKNGSVQNSYPLVITEEEEKVSQSVPPGSDDRLTDIENAIPEALTAGLHDTPSPELLRRISRNLGDAPLERFTERIYARWKSITSLGLLAELALDVGKAWKAEKKAQQNGNHPPPTSDEGLAEQKLLAERERILADYRAGKLDEDDVAEYARIFPGIWDGAMN